VYTPNFLQVNISEQNADAYMMIKLTRCSFCSSGMLLSVPGLTEDFRFTQQWCENLKST